MMAVNLLSEQNGHIMVVWVIVIFEVHGGLPFTETSQGFISMVGDD